MSITVTPRTPLRLFMVVQTMTSRRQVTLPCDGEEALRRYTEADRDHLTVSCYLYNQVRDPATGRDEAILVHAHEDVMPRWITQERDARLRREAAAVADREARGFAPDGTLLPPDWSRGNFRPFVPRGAS